MGFIEAYQQAAADSEAARLAKMTPLQRQIDQMMQFAAAMYVPELAPEALLTEGGQSLYRVVSESEYQSLMQEGKFTAPASGGSTPIPGQPGKWFWGSQQAAEQFGPYWYGNEPYRIIQTQIPNSIAPAVIQSGIDNIGTGYFFRLQDLQGATIQTIR
jgi:hypothetical protein